MTWYDLISSTGYFGVLEFESTKTSDSEFASYLPALEVKLSRMQDRLIAEWRTEDGEVLARVVAGSA